MATGQSTFKKVLKTVFLITVWICIGLCLEITGPTLKDLKLKENANYEDVSRAVSGRSLGFFVGAVFGGLLVDKLPYFCDIIIAVSIDGMAGCIIAAPHTTTVNLLWFFLFAAGTFEGIINIAGQKLILDIWLEKASSPMHALHLGFGIGSFIVPEISNPFLAKPATKESFNSTLNMTFSSMSTILPPSSTVQEYITESRIEWAYLIVGVITIGVSGIFYTYQLCKCREESGIEAAEIEIDTKKQPKEAKSKETKGNIVRNAIKLVDPATCAAGERFYGAQIFLLLFFHFFMAVGAERVYGKFIRSYAIDKLKFSGDSATLINTTFWISFSLGRFAGFILARWVPIRILIIIEAFGLLTSTILLSIFARDSSTMLWVLTQPYAFFTAPLFPSGIAWSDYHMQMTGMGITFLLFGGGIGGMCHMWIIGYLYDNISVDTFLYYSLGISCAAVLFVVLLTLRSWGKGSRFKQSDQDEAISEKQSSSL